MNPPRNRVRFGQGSTSPVMGSGGFEGYLGSGAGFRRNSEAINGQLTSFLWTVLRAVAQVFGKGASYG
jgi:hypothetical protein